MRHRIRHAGRRMAGLGGRTTAAVAVAVVAGAGLVLPLSGPAGANTPDTLYVADQNCACVWLVPSSGQPEIYEGIDESPQDVAVDTSGNLYWTEIQDGAVRELTSSDQLVELASGFEPWGIGVDGSGNVFFGTFGASGGGSGLYEIPSGGSAQQLTDFGGAWTSVAVDGNDDIWGVGGSDDLLLFPAGASGPVQVELPGASGVTGVRLDADDDLFATTGFGDSAVELPAGATSSTVLASLGQYTEGIAVDTSGNVFVGQPSTVTGYGKVYEVTPGNSPILYASGEIAETGGLAVSPTPAPASRAATTVSLTSDPTSTSVSAADTVVLTATVSSGGGLVQFDDNGYAIGEPVAVANGVAQLSTSLPIGSDVVTATYLGDGDDAPSTSAGIAFTVSGAPSTTTLTAPDGTRVPGTEDATMTATVTGAAGSPTGSVTFMNGSFPLGYATVTNGVATASIPLSPGWSHVTADYSGDSTYATSTSAPVAFHSVAPYPSTTTADESTGTPTSAGEPVTLAVTVLGVVHNGAPHGSVTATDGFTCGKLVQTSKRESATSCTHVVPSPTNEAVTVTFKAAVGHYAGSSDDVQVIYEPD